MEWAYELINGFKAGDARATNIVRNSRNIVVPIVNPDGFEASRTAGSLGGADGGRDESRRRHRLPRGRRHDRRRVPAQELPPAGRLRGRQLRDLARGWPRTASTRTATTAGSGAARAPTANNPLAQTYRGPGPFSEPETRNIQSLVSRNQVVDADHQPHDRRPRAARARPGGARRPGRREPRLQGARRRRWPSTTATSARSRSSSTTRPARPRTGATTRPAASASRSRSTAAPRTTRPATATTRRSTRSSRRWSRSGTATSPQADHAGDPGPDAGFDGQGNREAYYIAAESTLNEQRHSVLEGSAPAGATLRLTKAFKTETFPQPPDDEPILFDDKLETDVRGRPVRARSAGT